MYTRFDPELGNETIVECIIIINFIISVKKKSTLIHNKHRVIKEHIPLVVEFAEKGTLNK